MAWMIACILAGVLLFLPAICRTVAYLLSGGRVLLFILSESGPVLKLAILGLGLACVLYDGVLLLCDAQHFPIVH